MLGFGANGSRNGDFHRHRDAVLAKVGALRISRTATSGGAKLPDASSSCSAASAASIAALVEPSGPSPTAAAAVAVDARSVRMGHRSRLVLVRVTPKPEVPHFFPTTVEATVVIRGVLCVCFLPPPLVGTIVFVFTNNWATSGYSRSSAVSSLAHARDDASSGSSIKYLFHVIVS